MTHLKMPAYGISEVGGTVTEWLKHQGDSVDKGEPIVVVETEKAAVELEAPAGGILTQILAKQGDLVGVGESLAVIGDQAEAADRARDAKRAQREIQEAAGGFTSETAPVKLVAEPAADRVPRQLNREPSMKVAPAARRLANRHGLDLSGVKGTGPQGRIVKSDVEALVAAAPSNREEETNFADQDGQIEREDLSPVRRVIADRMTESATSIPHFHLTVDIDASAIVSSQNEFRKTGTPVSITAILVKISGLTLRDFPRLNSSWRGDHVAIYKSVHMNVAIATSRGLFAPVIQDITSKTATEIAAVLQDLARRSKDGRLRHEELTGGTFTLTNLGAYGVRQFNPIINPLQCSILAAGVIAERPFVLDGVVGVRPEMTLTLASDHRIVDGAEAAQFLDALRQNLEKPELQ